MTPMLWSMPLKQHTMVTSEISKLNGRLLRDMRKRPENYPKNTSGCRFEQGAGHGIGLHPLASASSSQTEQSGPQTALQASSEKIVLDFESEVHERPGFHPH